MGKKQVYFSDYRYDVPVCGQHFLYEVGQECYIHILGDVLSGKITAKACHPESTENQYRIQLTNGVVKWYSQTQIVGRKYSIFDSDDNIVDDKQFISLQEAIDFEEDLCYDVLEECNERGHDLFSCKLEIWEINQIGERIRKVQLV